MKRIIIYIAVLLAVIQLPVGGMDVGKLKPVGLIQIYKEGETVFVVTDTGDAGEGKTVDAAFENLEETTAGVIFLDTADYLLIGRTAIYDAEGLARYLKPTIDVCIAGKEIDPVQAAEHLAVHHPRVELKDKNAIQRAQTLVAQNGRLVLK